MVMKRVVILYSVLFLLSFFNKENYTGYQCVIPFLVPAAILAGTSLATTIFGASKAGKAERENKKILDEAKQENLSTYLRDYYRGTLDNPSSKAYLKRLDKSMQDRNKATENTATATGATQENVLAAKQANNEVMSDAIGNIVQGEEARKDAIQDRYLQRKSALLQGDMNMNTQRAQNWMNTAQGISNAAANLASAYLMSGSKFTSNIPSLQGQNMASLNPAYVSDFDSRITADAAKQFKISTQ
jgi:hypothetical protein